MSSISTGVDPEVARWTRKWKHWIAEPMRRAAATALAANAESAGLQRIARPTAAGLAHTLARTRLEPLVEPDSGRLQNR
jgi:hypothetical protein